MNVASYQKVRGIGSGSHYGNDDTRTIRVRSRNRKRNKVSRRSRKINFGLYTSSRQRTTPHRYRTE